MPTPQISVASTLPALSKERYRKLCRPSLAWSAGAGTSMLVPLCQVVPPSELNCVPARPEPPVSFAVSMIVTGLRCQRQSALSRVCGGAASMSPASTVETMPSPKAQTWLVSVAAIALEAGRSR